MEYVSRLLCKDYQGKVTTHLEPPDSFQHASSKWNGSRYLLLQCAQLKGLTYLLKTCSDQRAKRNERNRLLLLLLLLLLVVVVCARACLCVLAWVRVCMCVCGGGGVCCLLCFVCVLLVVVFTPWSSQSGVWLGALKLSASERYLMFRFFTLLPTLTVQRYGYHSLRSLKFLKVQWMDLSLTEHWAHKAEPSS